MSGSAAPEPSTSEEQSATPAAKPSTSGSSSSSGSSSLKARVTPSVVGLSYKAGADALSPSGSVAQSLAVQGLSGPSRPADAGALSAVGAATGTSISGAREHTGPKAQAACEALGAEAYTVGSDVAYASSSPSTHTKLHEYAHVAQQTGVPNPSAQAKGSAALTPSGNLEAEADAVASAVMSGGQAAVSVGQAPRVSFKKTPKWKESEASKAVKNAHGVEMDVVISKLDGITTNAELTEALDIMSHWPSSAIDAFWKTHEMWGERHLDFVDNCETVHFQSHPREILASFGALNADKQWELALDYGKGANEAEACRVLFLIQGWSSAWLDAFYKADKGRPYRDYYNNCPGWAKTSLKAGVNPDLEEDLQGQEQKRQTKAAKEVSLAKKKGIKDAIKAIKDWLRGITSDNDTYESFKWFQYVYNTFQEAGLSHVVRSLEGDGWMDDFCSSIPEAYAFRKDNVGLFIQILRQRPPESAIKHATSLLSYGIFDWAVTDHEALIAYRLIKSLPDSVQHKFRMRDANKWFVRMERQLNPDVFKGKKEIKDKNGKVVETHHYHDDDEAYGLVDGEAGRGEKGKKTEAQKAELEEDMRILNETDEAFLEGLGAIMKGDPKSGLVQLYGKGDAKCRAWTRHFDRQGTLETMFWGLGTDRWKPPFLKMVLKVLRYRDPVYNLPLIRDVMSYGLFDWEINCDEARIAYELIKALPAGIRKEFIDKEPLWFQRMESNISQELRESRDFGLYDDEQNEDKPQLIAQLFDPKLWEKENIPRLNLVLKMIAQAGLQEQAAATICQHYDTHSEVLSPHGYTSKGYVPEHVVDKTDSNTTSMVGGLVGAASTHSERGFWSAVGYGTGMTDSMDVDGLKMDKVQDALGGSVFGVKFKPTEEHETGKEGQDPGEVDIEVDEEKGFAQVKAAALEIANVNMMTSGITVRADGGHLHQLLAEVKYATDVDPKTYLKLHCGQFRIQNLMLVFPDRMIGIGEIVIDGFKVDGEREKAPLVYAKDGWLMDALKFGGRLIELTAKIASLGQFFGDWTRDFGAFAQHIRDALGKDLNLNVKIAGISAKDITDSRGGHVREVAVGKVDLNIDLSPVATMKNQLTKLKKEAGDKPTQEQKDEIERLELFISEYDDMAKELAELKAKGGDGKELSDKDQARIQELEKTLNAVSVVGRISARDLSDKEAEEYKRLQAADPATLSPKDQARLDELEKKSKGIYIKDADILGFKADEMAMEGLTVEGTIPGLGAALDGARGRQHGLYADSKIAGKGIDSGQTAYGQSSLTVRADSLTGKNVSYSSQELRHKTLEKKIESLKKGVLTESKKSQIEAAERELAMLKGHVKRLDELQALMSERALTPEEQQEYRRIISILQAPPMVKIAEMDLQGARIGATLQPDKGSLTTEGMAASFGADSGTLKGVEAGGVAVGELTGQGLNLTVDEDKVTVGAHHAKATDVVTTSRKSRLEKELATCTDPARIEAINAELKLYHDLKATVERLSEEVKGLEDQIKKDPRLENQAYWDKKHELDRRKAELAAWGGEGHKAQSVEVDGVGLQVTGLGDMMKSGWEMPSSGVTIAGTGKDGEIASKIKVTGAELAGSSEQDPKKLGDIEVNNLGGVVKIVDENHWKLTGMKVGKLSASGIRFRSGDMLIETLEEGSVGLELETLDADIYWKIAKENGAYFRKFDKAIVSLAKVPKLWGKQLHLVFSGKDVTLADGSITGIEIKQFRVGGDGTHTFDQVKAEGLSLTDLTAKMGEGTEACIGNLSTGEIKASSVEAGKYKASIQDIAGSDISYTQPGLGVTIRSLQDGDINDLSYDSKTGLISFPDVHLNVLDFSKIAYDSPEQALYITSMLKGTDVTIKGSIDLRTDPEKKALAEKAKAEGKKPPKDEALDGMKIDLLDIKLANFAGLRLVDKKRLFDLRVSEGDIHNLVVKGFALGKSSMSIALGKTDIRGLDFTQKEWVEDAKGKKVLQQALHVGANQIKADSLGVKILSDKHMKLDFDNLTTDTLIAEVGKSDKANIVAIAMGDAKAKDDKHKGGLSGSVDMNGDATTLNLSLGTLKLINMTWDAGDSEIVANNAFVRGATVDAKILRNKEGAIDSVDLKKVHADEVDADHFRYVDKKTGMTVEINKEMKKGKGLEVKGVDVTNFKWSGTSGIEEGTIGVQSVGFGQLGVDIEKSLALNASGKAEGISVNFAKDGKIITRVKDIDATYDVNDLSGNQVKGTLTDADTGVITIGPDEITMPGIDIGSVQLDYLAVISPALVAHSDKGGGRVRLEGIKANIVVKRRTPEEIKAAPTLGAIKSVTVKTLDVEKVIAGGQTLWLTGGITIKLPKKPEGTLEKLHVEGLNLQAPTETSKDWVIDGKVDISKMDFKKMGLVVGSLFDGKLDVSTTKKMTIELLGLKGRKIRIPDLNIDNVDGNLSGLPITVEKGTVSGLKVDTDEKGQTSVESDGVTVSGIDVDTPSFWIHIEEAKLPKGFEVPKEKSKPIDVRDLHITKAKFKVKDIAALSAAGGGPSVYKLKDKKFLDTISGEVKASIHFIGKYPYWGMRNTTHSFHLDINKGLIDIKKLEHGLSGLEDLFVNFGVEDDKLKLFVAGDATLEWDLSKEDKKNIRVIPTSKHTRKKILTKVHVSTFAEGRLVETDESREKEDRIKVLEAKKASEGLTDDEQEELDELKKPPVEIFVLNFNDIHTVAPEHLSMKGASVIDLGAGGKIHLGTGGEDGVDNLRLSGALSMKGVSKGLDLSIGAINASCENLKVGPATLNTGSIDITGIKNVHVAFDQLAPKSVKGEIDSAIAKDIKVKM